MPPTIQTPSVAPDLDNPRTPAMTTTLEAPALKAKDYGSDQDVRWCPGCGDYAILNQVKKVFAKLQIPRERTVFVSGIGCSSRFPYYMNTYGFHTIHGRAPAVVTGLKIANPQLDVWMVTGDGDGLSIGGNHLLHVLRRNVNVKILLFNNQIYGLTKGQYSPTSPAGQKTKSSPMGAIDLPLSPISVALAAECSFAARAIDVDADLVGVLERAAAHRGAAFVEIYQDCNIFNHNAFAYATEKESKEEHILRLQHGKPMIFGKNRDKGIMLDKNGKPKVVSLGGESGLDASALLLHDENDDSLAFMLSRLKHPQFPEPMGVFYRAEDQCYEDVLEKQVRDAINAKGAGTLQSLFNDGDIYTVGD